MSPGGRGVYKMRTIARLTGFSPELLRAWERRHALLSPERGAGGHRLYTEGDLAVLREVRALVDAGRSIGEIAALGREALLASGGAREVSAAVAPAEIAPPAAPPSLDFARLAPSPCPLTRAGAARLAEAIARAACALDRDAVARALDEAFATLPPEVAVHGVLEPAAVEIGRLWAEGRCPVAGEHLASALFVRRLVRLLEDGRAASPRAPLAITGCLPEELHEIGALVVALHLHRAGARVTHLGPSLPVEEIGRAVDALRPSAVLLSVSRFEVLVRHLAPLSEMISRRAAGTRFLVGGAGVRDALCGTLERAGSVVWRPERPLSGLAEVFGPALATAPPLAALPSPGGDAPGDPGSPLPKKRGGG